VRSRFCLSPLRIDPDLCLSAQQDVKGSVQMLIVFLACGVPAIDLHFGAGDRGDLLEV